MFYMIFLGNMEINNDLENISGKYQKFVYFLRFNEFFIVSVSPEKPHARHS